MADTVAITPGAGVSIAADDVGGVFHQRIKRSVGADGLATDFLDRSVRSDDFTATANGVTVDVNQQGMKYFSIQVAKTGNVTSWTVVLEVSLDGTNFRTILTHDSVGDGDLAINFTATPYPALYFRSRCSAISLGAGTKVTATIVGMP